MDDDRRAAPDEENPVERYLAEGRQAMLELLFREHAAVWPEVQAKIADVIWPTLENVIDPHHLTTIRRDLLREGVIEQIAAPTRGRHVETVLALSSRRSERAFETAAARKRLLLARYHSWGRTSRGHANLLGSAGERVVRTALQAAAPGRYTLLPTTATGEVAQLFGRTVPGGPLDTAAFLALTDSRGRPTGIQTLVVEVKNVRHWIYPESAELYDLLDKAARLQVANPETPFVPVLVCRRAHTTTFNMAQQLGFFVVETRAQFLLNTSSVRADHVQEVDNELGFSDLVLVSPNVLTPSQSLVRRFAVVLPRYAARTAERLVRSAPIIAKFSGALRRDTLADNVRRNTFTALHSAAEDLPDFDGGW
jgi:hypothetical protein